MSFISWALFRNSRGDLAPPILEGPNKDFISVCVCVRPKWGLLIKMIRFWAPPSSMLQTNLETWSLLEKRTRVRQKPFAFKKKNVPGGVAPQSLS